MWSSRYLLFYPQLWALQSIANQNRRTTKILFPAWTRFTSWHFLHYCDTAIRYIIYRCIDNQFNFVDFVYTVWWKRHRIMYHCSNWIDEVCHFWLPWCSTKIWNMLFCNAKYHTRKSSWHEMWSSIMHTRNNAHSFKTVTTKMYMEHAHLMLAQYPPGYKE